MNHEPLNIAGAKSSFSCMYVVGTTYFNECFLFHVIKVYRYSEVVFCCFFSNHRAIGFFETKGNPIQSRNMIRVL